MYITRERYKILDKICNMPSFSNLHTKKANPSFFVVDTNAYLRFALCMTRACTLYHNLCGYVGVEYAVNETTVSSNINYRTYLQFF